MLLKTPIKYYKMLQNPCVLQTGLGAVEPNDTQCEPKHTETILDQTLEIPGAPTSAKECQSPKT